MHRYRHRAPRHIRQQQALQRQGNGLHVAVRPRARDLQGLGRRHEGLALQRAANDLDQRVGQVREIAQGLIHDGPVLAEAAAQPVGLVDLILVSAGRGDDVSGSGASGQQGLAAVVVTMPVGELQAG